MSGHARLQPSTAHRWTTCPGSVAFAATFPDRPTRAAAEGTACHLMLHEMLTSGAEPEEGRVVEVDGFRVEVTEDMASWAREVGDYVLSYVRDHPGAWVLSEERICPGRAFGCPDDFWGTADVIISEPDRLTVLDAKFGHRAVRVQENPQLVAYALGAMDEFGWAHPSVTLAIHQPRAGGLKTWEMSADDLRERQRAMAPKVLRALAPNAELVASEEGCEWCPAAGACPEAQRHSLALARGEFPAVPMAVDDLVAVLDRADQIRDALRAAEQYAETLLATGQAVPGWKRVYGDKHRAWRDERAAAEAIRALGYEPTKSKLVTPAQAEKMVGKATAKALAPLIEKPRGEPKLARADDPREEVAPDFPSQ